MPSVPLCIHRLAMKRRQHRFTQQELASEIGISRASLSNYESGVQEMPFSVGLALCRRLNVSPRWAIDGEQPETPFIELSEIGLDESKIQLEAQKMGFQEGYPLLKTGLDLWFQKHSMEEIVMLQLRRSAEKEVRGMSLAQLHELIAEMQQQALDGNAGALKVMREAQRELEARLAIKVPRRSRKKKPALGALVNERVGNLVDIYQATPDYFISMDGSLLAHWIARANSLVSHRGGKAALARHLGVTPQSVHEFLTGASAPSAENILRIQAWVIASEAKKGIPGSAGTLPGTKTRTRKSENENTQSSQEAG